jgi:WD40 repeat protein
MPVRRGGLASIKAVTFTPDDSLLVAGAEPDRSRDLPGPASRPANSVVSWKWYRRDIGSFWQADKSLYGQPPTAVAVLFGAHGRALASVGADGTITLRDADTLTVQAQLSNGTGRTSLAFDSASRVVATVDADGTPILWDTDVDRVLKRIGSLGPPPSARDRPSPSATYGGSSGG